MQGNVTKNNFLVFKRLKNAIRVEFDLPFTISKNFSLKKVHLIYKYREFLYTKKLIKRVLFTKSPTRSSKENLMEVPKLC